MVAVVSAAIRPLYYLAQLHCDVSVGQTSAPVCLRSCKKRENNRRLDNAVADTSQSQSLNFVTTTLSEGGGTSTTCTGSSRVRPDARQPDGSRSLSVRHIAKLSETGNPSSRSMPCRPKGPFAISSENGNSHAHFLGNTYTNMHMLGLCE